MRPPAAIHHDCLNFLPRAFGHLWPGTHPTTNIKPARFMRPTLSDSGASAFFTFTTNLLLFHFTPPIRHSCKLKALWGGRETRPGFVPAADLCRFVLRNILLCINLLSGCPCYLLTGVCFWFSAKGRLTACWRGKKKTLKHYEG